MRVSIFVGDVADAEADAICTSTNPRLSLMMGTGAAVRGRGGYEVLAACEAIMRECHADMLPPGTAYVTPAGALPHKAVIHCVASDAADRSSDAIIESCVTSALRCADEQRCRSVAMPIFATGHAHANFPHAVELMAEVARRTRTAVEEISFVIIDPERACAACNILERTFHTDVAITVREAPRADFH
jgi:O-acetyl-ADP-ribose deacetylase (regulator of RNase III)